MMDGQYGRFPTLVMPPARALGLTLNRHPHDGVCPYCSSTRTFTTDEEYLGSDQEFDVYEAIAEHVSCSECRRSWTDVLLIDTVARYQYVSDGSSEPKKSWSTKPKAKAKRKC